ncbi:DUF4179 domain-containing protein [Lysinibacillus fusiformis]|nr:DUF4179 domain-containing protein [Lysinibacillus fusiformis]
MKKLYKQLNRFNIEFDVEPMEVSELEKESIKRKILKGKRKKHYVRNFVAAATFLIALGFTVGTGFPAFAEKLPFIGNVFELFNADKVSMFERFDDYSSAIGITEESNGVEVTVTDAVYDRENITIAYIIKSEKNLGEKPALSSNVTAKELKFADIYEYTKHDIVEKISENEYAVLFIYELIKGTKPEEVHITFEGDEIHDFGGTNISVEGNWSFNFNLSALESENVDLAKEDIKTEAEGIEINAIELTETPISTTIYLSEKVDVRLVAKEEEKWRGVRFDYIVTDNLGNTYNFVQSHGLGHSTDFERMRSEPRLTIKNIDEEATSLTITPSVNVYEKVSGEGELANVFEPYSIEPIIIPIK